MLRPLAILGLLVASATADPSASATASATSDPSVFTSFYDTIVGILGGGGTAINADGPGLTPSPAPFAGQYDSAIPTPPFAIDLAAAYGYSYPPPSSDKGLDTSQLSFPDPSAGYAAEQYPFPTPLPFDPSQFYVSMDPPQQFAAPSQYDPSQYSPPDMPSQYYDAFTYPPFAGPDDSSQGFAPPSSYTSPFASLSSFDSSQYSYGGYPMQQQGQDAAPPAGRRLHFYNSDYERSSRHEGRNEQRRRRGGNHHHHRRHQDEESPRHRRHY